MWIAVTTTSCQAQLETHFRRETDQWWHEQFGNYWYFNYLITVTESKINIDSNKWHINLFLKFSYECDLRRQNMKLFYVHATTAMTVKKHWEKQGLTGSHHCTLWWSLRSEYSPLHRVGMSVSTRWGSVLGQDSPQHSPADKADQIELHFVSTSDNCYPNTKI